MRGDRATRQVDNVREQVAKLFSQAAAAPTQALANRSVSLARQLAMRFRVRFLPAQKRQFCKSCWTYLRPGVNCRVRVRDGKTTYACLSCKRVQRVPYK